MTKYRAVLVYGSRPEGTPRAVEFEARSEDLAIEVARAVGLLLRWQSVRLEIVGTELKAPSGKPFVGTGDAVAMWRRIGGKLRRIY